MSRLLHCLVLVCCISAVVSGSEMCLICSELWSCHPLAGQRIDVRESTTLEIDSATSSFVRHGWVGIPEEAVTGWDVGEICGLMQQAFEFHLFVNETEVPWEHFDIALLEIDGVRRWSPTIYIQFPAGYFAVGVYILRSVFAFHDVPRSLFGCTDEMRESDLLTIADDKFSYVLEATITLTAL